jgi:UDP-glucose 4-epimerase
MHVLITGIAGFGGSGLARELLDGGHTVSGLDIIGPAQTGLDDNFLEKLVDYHWKSCQDMDSEDLIGVDVVVHMAAQADVPMGFPSPRWTVENNTMATVGVLEAIRRHKARTHVTDISKVILASSGNVFGRPLYLPIDEKHPQTCHNPYSASKACQEMLFWAYHRSYGIPIVIMRNGIVYGPGMRREIFVFKWLKAMLRGHDVFLQGGDQTRDPCFGSDTMDAWKRVVEADPEKVVGEIFQVSYGKEWTVRSILDKCIEAAERYGAKKPTIIQAPYRPGEQGQREAFDITKARKILGYNPKIDLEKGLDLTAGWIKNLENHLPQ